MHRKRRLLSPGRQARQVLHQRPFTAPVDTSGIPVFQERRTRIEVDIRLLVRLHGAGETVLCFPWQAWRLRTAANKRPATDYAEQPVSRSC